ncbi:hypothetical protein ACL02R_27875 [Streptomyces sp. MS19]|uniref:hypothetical protein n=1 Tax=Streptomyces sp. MS19 TaxID=3385972 RepID=UPI0039A07FF4
MEEELAAVLRDIGAQCAVPPLLRPTGVPETPLMLCAPDGSGAGLNEPRGTRPGERLADLADQVQDWAVEALWGAGLPAVWPVCPAHPDTHPLAAAVRDGAAVWTCPRTGAAVARVGELPGAAEAAEGAGPARVRRRGRRSRCSGRR